MSTTEFQLVARTGHPTFLGLPWAEPLEEWTSDRLVNLIRGISRHVVRFVKADGQIFAVKEATDRFVLREHGLFAGTCGSVGPRGRRLWHGGRAHRRRGPATFLACFSPGT